MMNEKSEKDKIESKKLKTNEVADVNICLMQKTVGIK